MIGSENTDIDFSSPNAIESATPAFHAYVADLRRCMTSPNSVPTTQP